MPCLLAVVTDKPRASLPFSCRRVFFLSSSSSAALLPSEESSLKELEMMLRLKTEVIWSWVSNGCLRMWRSATPCEIGPDEFVGCIRERSRSLHTSSGSSFVNSRSRREVRYHSFVSSLCARHRLSDAKGKNNAICFSRKGRSSRWVRETGNVTRRSVPRGGGGGGGSGVVKG